jgi:predicted transcriptional regulator
MSTSTRNPQVNIRLPNVLREALKLIALENDRSVNYVVVEALKDFVAQKTKPQLR